MNIKQAKEAALEATMGLPDKFGARDNLVKLVTEFEKGGAQWQELETPAPAAMRSFQGTTKNYVASVVQAKIEGEGVQCRGMAVAKPGLVIVLPPPIAEFLYRQASTQRN